MDCEVLAEWTLSNTQIINLEEGIDEMDLTTGFKKYRIAYELKNLGFRRREGYKN